MSPEHFRVNKIDLMFGRPINDVDIKEKRRVVVMDSNDAREPYMTSSW